MQTLHNELLLRMDTIATNWHRLTEAHIDWSPDGGMFWLTTMMVAMALPLFVGIVRGN